MTVYCTFCGNGFSRAEHLERHLLIHNDARPFSCETCHLSFRRRDLLRRHIRNAHAPPTADDPQGIAKPPDRSPHACINCVKNKTKCDKDMPCTRCVQRGWTCEPRPSRRSQKHPKASAEQDKALDREQSSSAASTADTAADEQGPAVHDQDAVLQTPSPLATTLFSLDQIPAPDPKAFIDHSHLSEPSPLLADIPHVHQLYFENTDNPDFGWLDDGMMPGLTMDGESIETSPEPPNSARLLYPPPTMTADCGSPLPPVPAMQPGSDYFGTYEASLEPHKETMQSRDDRLEKSDFDMTSIAHGAVSEPTLNATPPYVVETFTADARDRLIMVVQRVLHMGSQRSGAEMQGYLQLPQPNVLESLLHGFMQNDQAYFDLIPGRFLETSVLVQSGDYGTLPGLFLLLALAKGAICSGSADGCALADTLMNACLAALSDVTVKTSHWQGGFKAFHSLLLLQDLAAWSSSSNTQKIGRSMWMKGIKMLHEDDLMEYKPLQLGPSVDKEASFHLWRNREYQSR
ncbi:hypothetical protein BFW01_g5797 [Lasiodiplodia theobromae]|nr:hypothetical protein BFW01_g5797 [Lasiodiplodia theobromae]